jgi:hypothetical protein
MKGSIKKTGMLSAAVSLVAGAAILAPASAAYAINEVNCNESGYLYIHFWDTIEGYDYEAKRCWANKGETEMDIYGSISMSSGNNAGYIITSGNGRVNFGKFQDKDLNGIVTYLHID